MHITLAIGRKEAARRGKGAHRRGRGLQIESPKLVNQFIEEYRANYGTYEQVKGKKLITNPMEDDAGVSKKMHTRDVVLLEDRDGVAKSLPETLLGI
ncbi:hypothetical protein ACH5RR_018297 [Cinchona calisaya]|uniref:Uncharacterized protein n=1 Tax=Cinchona calisaya TaxID=153742 RepID=A0ABD2ZMC6_9GENT